MPRHDISKKLIKGKIDTIAKYNGWGTIKSKNVLYSYQYQSYNSFTIGDNVYFFCTDSSNIIGMPNSVTPLVAFNLHICSGGSHKNTFNAANALEIPTNGDSTKTDLPPTRVSSTGGNPGASPYDGYYFINDEGNVNLIVDINNTLSTLSIWARIKTNSATPAIYDGLSDLHWDCQ